jgi:hypothetical protein
MNILTGQTASRSGQDMDRFSNSQSGAGVGALEYAALLRKLDKLDPSYKV